MQYPWLLEGQKIFRVVIIAQLVISVVIGLITGELLPAIIFGIPIAAVPLVLSLQSPLFSIKPPCYGHWCAAAYRTAYPSVIWAY